MRVTVTLDYYDGSKGKARDVDLADGADMQQLLFLMMQREVCGYTVTKRGNLSKAIKLAEGGEQ